MERSHFFKPLGMKHTYVDYETVKDSAVYFLTQKGIKDDEETSGYLDAVMAIKHFLNSQTMR
jgi:hypothetical protein